MTTRVAIYARYSSDLQEPTSIADQIAMARAFCAREGWVVVEEFADEETTGRHARRPGLSAMIQAAGQGRFDLILVEAVDRLTRRVADALGCYELLAFNDVRLHSIGEGRQDFLRVMLTAFGAQHYSEMVGLHTRRGIRRNVEERGRVHGLAYGYVALDVEEGLNRAVIPAEAAILRRIFEEFADGRSAAAIATGLNRDGIAPPSGRSWKPSTIRGNAREGVGILRNELYRGVSRVCRNTYAYHPETGARKVRPTPEDAVAREIPELRIIPEPLWLAVQAELARRAETMAKHGNASAAHRKKYLLSGLLRCGICGAPYIVQSRHSYRCREHRHGGCANRTPISIRRIETRVFNAIRRNLLTPEAEKRFDAALKAERARLAKSDPARDLKRLARKRAETNKRRDNIFRAIEAGAPFEAYRARAAVLEDEIEDLDRRIVEAEARTLAAPEPPPDAATLYAGAVQRMETLLSDPDFVEQAHRHLATLIRSVTLTPDPEAPHGIAAEILIDLGGLLLAGGKEGLHPTQLNKTATDVQARGLPLPPPSLEGPRLPDGAAMH